MRNLYLGQNFDLLNIEMFRFIANTDDETVFSTHSTFVLDNLFETLNTEEDVYLPLTDRN